MKRAAKALLTLPILTGFACVHSEPALRHRNPPSLHKPTGYTHVVEAAGGRTLYISGQVAVDRGGDVVGAGDLKAQTRQVFENLRAALADSGATFDDVVKITVFMTDASQIQAFREIRDGYFTGELPASTLVQVARLARPELMIEIEAVAVVKSGG
ncbi:MAG: RidA family protein [Thermoanaerobaculia bacterium]